MTTIMCTDSQTVRVLSVRLTSCRLMCLYTQITLRSLKQQQQRRQQQQQQQNETKSFLTQTDMQSPKRATSPRLFCFAFCCCCGLKLLLLS